MNEILVASLAQRISLGMMTMEQVPPIYREAVQERLDAMVVVINEVVDPEQEKPEHPEESE